jgi:predicted nucleic acid-binding protein
MSINRVVLNASPLICLSKSGLADLIPALFREVFVPEAVFQEVMAEGKTDFAAEWLSSQRWIRRLRDIPIDPRVAAWDLGEGESAVLSFALRNEDCCAVMDDREARRCAAALKCRFIGTLGIMVLAKKRGNIESVRQSLKKLPDAGFWIADALVEDICRKAGEN